MTSSITDTLLHEERMVMGISIPDCPCEEEKARPPNLVTDAHAC